ncbi:MAG: hypothetical protein ACYC64_06620 [Armatimonadota bacterium]
MRKHVKMVVILMGLLVVTAIAAILAAMRLRRSIRDAPFVGTASRGGNIETKICNDDSLSLPATRNTKSMLPQTQAIESPMPRKPTVVPLSQVLPDFAPSDGREHRRLQHFIKQLAEKYGYKAEVDQPIVNSQDKVDVGLERDGRKIACEVCVTIQPEQELYDVVKCLTSGYNLVILCSSQKKTLWRVRSLCAAELSETDRQNVLFLEPADLALMFEQEAADAAGKVEKFKGYTVKVNFQALPESEKKAKREAIVRILVESLRREKSKQ